MVSAFRYTIINEVLRTENVNGSNGWLPSVNNHNTSEDLKPDMEENIDYNRNKLVCVEGECYLVGLLSV